MLFGIFASLLLLGGGEASALRKRGSASGGNYPTNFGQLTVPGGYAALPIDHFTESDTRTFHNRYWYNDTYYQPGGPVFFYDNGEDGIEPSEVVDTLQSGNNAALELARRFNGICILWEHRFYGYSQPFPVNMTTGLPTSGLDALKYLTFEQALEDAVYFAKTFNPYNTTTSDLDPSKTPWIWIGGSYPGARAQWIRKRNPETFYAAWSSSGPVNPLVDGSPYVDIVGSGLPQNCTTDINAAMRRFDAILEGSDRQAADHLGWFVMNASYTSQGKTMPYSSSVEFDNYDVASAMMGALASNFQYYTPTWTTLELCNNMESFVPEQYTNLSSTDYSQSVLINNPQNGVPTEQGIAASYGDDAALSAYVFGMMKSMEVQMQLEAKNPMPPPTFQSSGTWGWQVMSQFGCFEAVSDAYTKRHNGWSLYSKFYNITGLRQEGYIDEIPPSANIDVSKIPAQPDTAGAVQMYGGWNFKPSNTMITGGQFDPWRSFSVYSDETELGSPQRTPTTVVPKCNEVAPGNEVFGVVHPSAGHCFDLEYKTWDAFSLNPNLPQPFTVAVDLFEQALKEWLPCFGQGSSSDSTTTSSASSAPSSAASDTSSS